jgi:uncharacterized sporulation protein YeaH/YhbH (DUF444 family)
MAFMKWIRRLCGITSPALPSTDERVDQLVADLARLNQLAADLDGDKINARPFSTMLPLHGEAISGIQAKQIGALLDVLREAREDLDRLQARTNGLEEYLTKVIRTHTFATVARLNQLAAEHAELRRRIARLEAREPSLSVLDLKPSEN